MSERGGQPDNKNAVTKGQKQFWHALNRAIVQTDGEKLRLAAEMLLTKAAEGEGWAIKELADRLDGKPAQSVQVSDADGNNLFSHIQVTLVGKNAGG